MTAYLRMFLKAGEPDVVQMGRVLTREHGEGLGQKILTAAIHAAVQYMSAKEIYLESQRHAEGFYLRRQKGKRWKMKMEEFRNLVLCDYKDDKIWIIVRASLANGSLEISGHDLGEEVEDIWDDEDYEYWYSLNTENTGKLLNLICGEGTAADAIKREFSGIDGCKKLREFCEANSIEYNFFSYT